MGARVAAHAAVSVVVCLGLAQTRPVVAQPGAALSGTVVDSAGAVLPGVTVRIEGAAPPPITVVTDAKGAFAVATLAPGGYRIVAALEGFKTSETRVTVRAGHPQRLTITLEVGGLVETISVSASPGLAMTSSAARAPAFRFDREAYRHLPENPFHRVSAQPRSTFGIDVDTASYANVRRMLNDGELPPEGAVRIEELINYFRFDYAAPAGDVPVAISTEVGPCPWNDRHLLALIGVRSAAALPRAASRPAGRNLVFLVDVSGSMADDDKLPLVKQSLHLLADRLAGDDRIALVVYAGNSGLALKTTSGADKATIHAAIDALEAGGSTNGGEGIELAYRLARQQFVAEGVNRVILATDGDFNVGVTSEDQLVRLIERERRSGVFLTVLGVGDDNLQDSTMEALADKGNGNYAYLDSLDEARKVLLREMDATLVTVAKDVKVQVEFNPAQVAGYRLIGYENRRLDDEDFNDDAKDAGDMGAGHTVTALYEIVPAAEALPGVAPDALEYQRIAPRRDGRHDAELLTVAVRYKRPSGGRSQRLEAVVAADARPLGPNLGFASAVAELGLLLTHSEHAGTAAVEQAIARARAFADPDVDGDRAGFVALAERAAGLMRQARDDR
jgi:Ca-activated chloride channel family protein